jgi:pseudouridine-5'-phosphate glycosidase
MSGSIESAVAEAAARGIRGKAVTPYILACLAAITGGRSLRANIALVRSNARLAAELAAAWAS